MSILNQGQIHSIFISLIIDGVQYGTIGSENSWSPQMITSLSVDKSASGRYVTADGYVFLIELNYLMVPDFYERILKLTKSNSDGLIPATLQYGYCDGECSPVYNLKLMSCEPTNLWSTLSLKFMQESSNNKYSRLTDATIKLLQETKYSNLSDLVTAVAESQGWTIGQIEPTKPYDGEIIYDSNLKSPLQMINELLTRYPNESTKDDGRYVSAFKHKLNDSIFYFVPTEIAEGNNSNYEYVESIDTYEFFFNALPQGKVISFTPKFVSNIIDSSSQSSDSNKLDPEKLQFEERPDLAVITSDSREIESIQYNIEDKQSSNNALGETESWAGYRNPGNVQLNINSSNLLSYIRSSIKENISKYVNVVGIRSSATLEIIGDPSLNVGDYITIIPMYQQSDYDTPGKIHPSGGVYRIKKITDTISLGNFSTKLELDAVDDRDFKVGEITSSTMDFLQVASSANTSSAEEG